MSTFEAAFKIVSDLVKDFKENEKSYLSPNYSEADVRNDFINKFFIAIGWDLRHEHQKNPYEQEVRVEKPVHVAKAQKRADYTFYLTPNFRDVKYFVEAKKPYHDLENKDYFFQTIRYGWNANTPIAVLTDFEEFIILDCRYRPNINDILNFKIKRFHYSEYANEDKFKEIYFLFSREAVGDNSLEKYANNLPKPKGKAVQRGLFAGGFQSIDEAFLEELDEIRNDLAKSFKKNNSHLTSEELTEATQRTIDRLVFIKFLEDKLIEPHHYVSGFGDRRSAWEDFITTSLTLDAKYNGVVFKKSLIDSRNIIEPDDKTFSKICEDLSHENTPYNFDAIPIHILGSIYERFLGKVVNATDKRVTIEEKPEVRKAGGVYYTPQYIVNYIVDNTIGKLIDGKTPKEIAKLRFADIACGSGSFLITIYERLLDYHKNWYIENPEQAKKDGCVLYENVYRLSLQQKQKILINNIYGVDLDHQAVQVTELSLYLKLLEDETTATANDTWVMFKEKLLPNLNKNIVCGNSLIQTDLLEGNLFNREEELKLKPRDFEDIFPDIMGKGGFDAIVGNPPYVRVHDIDLRSREYFRNKYLSGIGQFDLYQLFYERAFQLLKDHSPLGYITSNKFCITNYGKSLREWIVSNFRIEKIVDVSLAKVFGAVSTYPYIFIIIKENKLNSKVDIIELDKEKHFLIKKIIPQSNLLRGNENILTLSFDNKHELVEKIESISDMNSLLVYRGRGTTKDLSNEKRKNSVLSITNKEISRYGLSKQVYYKNSSKYEIDNDAKILMKKICYALESAIDELGEINPINTVYVLKSVKNLDLKYLLGILNSKLMTFYARTKYEATHLGGGYIELRVFEVEKLPIVNVYDKAKSEMLVDLVAKMLQSQKTLLLSKTENEKDYLEGKCNSLERQIDNLVYKLYGLTEEEIKIVEESAKC